MKIVIVGAGAQGAPCAAILARQSGGVGAGIEKILLASSTLAAAEAVRARVGSPKILAAQIDANDVEASVRTVRGAIGGADVVIDMTPSFCALNVLKTALALGAHYVNTAACPEHLDQFIHGRPLELDAQFKAAGKSALLGCGATPGVVNILCRRYSDEFDAVDRVEIRVGFHVPAQNDMVKTWMPTWSPEQQYFDFCDPPCLFHDGKHEHMPQFHEPEAYDFGGGLGVVQLTHHAHDEQYTLPLTIGKGIRYCCFKYPFEPAVATFFATGFTHDKEVTVKGVNGGVKVRAVDVLMELLPRPVQIAVLDRAVQEQLVPLIAATRGHILITGTSKGKPKRLKIITAVFLDQAARALELFDTANVGVPYAAATGALQLAEGKTKAGLVWPEQLDAARFIALTNTLGLTLNVETVNA